MKLLLGHMAPFIQSWSWQEVVAGVSQDQFPTQPNTSTSPCKSVTSDPVQICTVAAQLNDGATIRHSVVYYRRCCIRERFRMIRTIVTSIIVKKSYKARTIGMPQTPFYNTIIMSHMVVGKDPKVN